jgi:hypothetical protein
LLKEPNWNENPKGGPRAKKGRAFISLKDNEEEGKRPKKRKEKREGKTNKKKEGRKEGRKRS